jgi:hypothetical protein
VLWNSYPRYPRLRFLPEGKRLRQHLLALRGEGDLPLAAIRANLDLDEPLFGKRLQIPRQGSPVHHNRFRKAFHRNRLEIFRRHQESELRPAQAAGAQHVLIQLRHRARCLAQVETGAKLAHLQALRQRQTGMAGRHNRGIYTYEEGQSMPVCLVHPPLAIGSSRELPLVYELEDERHGERLGDAANQGVIGKRDRPAALDIA